MNIQDLIKQLSLLDPDLPVLMALDEEGNEFLPLDVVEYSAAVTYSPYEWQVLHPDDEEKHSGDLVRVVVLWP